MGRTGKRGLGAVHAGLQVDDCMVIRNALFVQATWAGMFGEDWSAAHARLQVAVQTALQGYWQRFEEEASSGTPAAVAPAVQVCPCKCPPNPPPPFPPPYVS